MSYFQLNPDLIQRWNDDGYFVARGLFTTEEIELLNTIARAGKDMDGALERPDTQGNISLLSVRNELLENDLCSAIAGSRRIVKAMEELLGDEVYHWHHKMMLKEPRVGGAWEWHQDYGYWYRNNHCLWPDMASCAIAVDRATKENGCLQVLKGSHKCGRIDHGQAAGQVGADIEQVEALVERLPLEYAELEPGDGLFFHSNTLHRSDANRSEHPRWTLICCYNTRHNDPYKQPSGHPAYTPLAIVDDEDVIKIGRKQWGAMKSGESA